MSWQPSLCQEVGDVVIRLLGGAVLLCVVSNAIFLFYLPSRRRRGSDGRLQVPRMESSQPADNREGGQHVSPKEQRSEAPSTDRRRSTAGQRNGGGPNGRLGSAAARPEQRRKPVVLFVPKRQLSGRASQPGGSLRPPVPDKPVQAIGGT